MVNASAGQEMGQVSGIVVPEQVGVLGQDRMDTIKSRLFAYRLLDLG